MTVVSRRSFAAMLWCLLFVVASGFEVSAQNVRRTTPTHISLNPMSVSRSGLYLQPYLPPESGWRYSFALDYGSSAEWENSVVGSTYVLDAELMRAQIVFRKDISPRRFIQFGLDLNGVFNGFADGAFDWYHTTMGIGFRGRENRPRNEFRYALSLPGGISVERERPDYFLGDLSIGYGMRHSAVNQTTFAITLPTSTAPEGYSKKTVFAGLVHTLRTNPSRRFSFEGSAGVGYTPKQGELAPVQLEFFNSASASVNVRLSQRNSFYGNVFTHSPLYKSTFLPELENREVTGGFGWMSRTRSGREWRVGVTEDFGPTDAGLDLILRFGLSW